MNVSAISNQYDVSSVLQQLYGYDTSSAETSLQPGQATAAGIGGVPSTDTAAISTSGQLFSELQNLQTTDPEKFRQIMTDEANKLQTAATQAGADTKQGQFLASIAQKFQDVADGGSLSELWPAAHHGHGHHHHSGGVQGTYNQNGQHSGVEQNAGAANSTVREVMSSIFADLEEAVQG